jgi:transcriptional regulator with XRE-family HTH domain
MVMGDAIKAAREAIGWSQSNLATVMGVAPGAVSRWETNRAVPVTSQAKWLRDYLGIEIVPAARYTPMTRASLAKLEDAVRARSEDLLAEAQRHFKATAVSLPPAGRKKAGANAGAKPPGRTRQGA